MARVGLAKCHLKTQKYISLWHYSGKTHLCTKLITRLILLNILTADEPKTAFNDAFFKVSTHFSSTQKILRVNLPVNIV